MGKPNVGKSTLFNRLINESKSMVHDESGFTRDCLSEKVFGVLKVPVLFTDTPGLEDPHFVKNSSIEYQLI